MNEERIPNRGVRSFLLELSYLLKREIIMNAQDGWGEIYLKIWLLTSVSEKFEVLNFIREENRELFSENFTGVPMENWVPPQVKFYQEGKESDFPSGLLSVPVFSEKAVEVLQEWLDGNVQLLPLYTTKNKKYYAGNVVNVLDCLNGERSEVKRFRSGRIMKYVKYAFVEADVKNQDIFRIVNHESKITIVTKVFVSDRFREKVLTAGLEGFDFIEVWDSNESVSIKEPEPQITNLSEESYTLDEALNYSEQYNVTFYSDKWAIRYSAESELEVGQLQDEGTYSWVTPIFLPPIFIEMKWRKKVKR